MLALISCSKEDPQGGDDSKIPVPEAVDLGLSVKWASCNLGASDPEGYGFIYQWAGTKDVTSRRITLDFNNCPYHIGKSSGTGWTKYVPSDRPSFWSGPGKPDDKRVLDLSDDVAHVKLGGKWRMPTEAEWEDLTQNCTWTWVNNYNNTGANGYLVTGKKPGFTGKFIFLPAAGFRNYSGLFHVGTAGHYWSSTLFAENPIGATGEYFNSEFVSWINGARFFGHSVRPVSD